jgi:triosephosphate isomerase
MKEPIIIGNWKMNMVIPDALKLVTALKNKLSGKHDAEVVVAPPFIALNSVYIALTDSNVKLAAQNVAFADKGAYTGEISAKMLAVVGCEYAIIGHSERRRYFSETNKDCNKKIAHCFEEGLTPIYCVGETLTEREAHKTLDVIELQLREGLTGFKVHEIENVVIAYEPVWAIGTGKPALTNDAESVHSFIREIAASMFGGVIADKVRIIYGGSVDEENISSFMREKNVNGALVGGASLVADRFARIVRYNEE